ncbi:hypothetical protein C0Q70_10763 [Pomacea canaliculata]|uniref:Uncharacterized protein n=1 Tax=Pomacea canaliculata TaxID=400727 RepID=A0A2T7P424_POMCA|nr:hypothetical protein C0Q70_10763 [Pomacea canaliculata]
MRVGVCLVHGFVAFLQMLESPLAASQWLNDPETGPILMQVLRIYQMRLNGNQISTTTDPPSVASPAASLTLASSPTTSTGTSSSSPPAPSSQANSCACTSSKSSPPQEPR